MHLNRQRLLLGASAFALGFGLLAGGGRDALAQCVPAAGGAGNDVINCAAPGAFANVQGQGGNDSVTIAAGAFILAVEGDGAGGAGTPGNDTIVLNGGNGLFTSLFGDDTGNTQTGNDVIVVNAGAAANGVAGGAGTDTIILNGGFLNTVFGDALAAGLAGAADVITIAGGTVLLATNGGDGDDTITMTGGSMGVGIGGNAGGDSITVTGGTLGVGIVGDAGDDIITVGGTASLGAHIRGDDDLNSVVGNDTIILNCSATVGTITGQQGEDRITLAGTALVLFDVNGDVGNDTLELSGTTVTGSVFGDGGNDSIVLSSGSIGVDIHGNGGDDRITLGGTAQVAGTVFGQGGLDTVELTGATNGTTLLPGDIFTGGDADSIVLTSGFVTGAVRAGDANDVIRMAGGVVGVNLDGDAGADTIVMSGGSVAGSVFGDDDADSITINGGTIDTNILAGAGNDTVILSDAFGSQLSNVDDLAGDAGNDFVFFLGTTGALGAGFDTWEAMFVANSAGPVGSVLDVAPIGGGDRTLGIGSETLFTLYVEGGSTLVSEGHSPTTLTVGDPGGALGDMALEGVFDMADADVDDALVVTNNFAGGGTIQLNAELDASEVADIVVIEGGVTGVDVPVPAVGFVDEGQTAILVTDLGDGIGALTGTGPGDGIAVVDVSNTGNTDDDDFFLFGGPLQVGIFDYDLFLEADGTWYLQSAPSEQAFADAAIPVSMIAFGRDAMGTLYERVGDRRNGASDPGIGVWLRGFGSWSEHEGRLDVNGGSLDGIEFEQDSWGVQAGADFEVMADETGRMVVGAYAVYGQSELDADDEFGNAAASLDWDVWGGGLTATWYGTGGLYFDLLGQVLVYDGDLTTAALGSVATPDGIGWGVSAEVGHAFALGSNFELVPQAQLAYQQVDFDDFDANGVSVAAEDGRSLEARLGVAAEFSFGTGSRAYVEANVLHEVLGDTEVTADGTTLAYDLNGPSAELGAGVTAQFGSIAVYGEVDYRLPFDDNDGTSSLQATAGVRFDF